MITLYEDDLYPGKKHKYLGKTIGEILEDHPSPRRFIKGFNAQHNDYCLSDEIRIDTKRNGYFHRK